MVESLLFIGAGAGARVGAGAGAGEKKYQEPVKNRTAPQHCLQAFFLHGSLLSTF